MWGYSVRVEGKRCFGEDIVKLIETLEAHAEFLSEIVKTEGTIDLVVHLPGDINVGDLLPWDVLARLAFLKVSLGVEVFPTFK
jgi:hypothetical protein